MSSIELLNLAIATLKEQDYGRTSAKSIVNTLARNGVETVDQLLAQRLLGIRKMRGIGFKKLRIIIHMRNKARKLEW